MDEFPSEMSQKRYAPNSYDTEMEDRFYLYNILVSI
jgi:hypothetical protein